MCELNVNRYLLKNYGQGGENARLDFHEAWLQTQDIPKALELAKTVKVEFKSRNPVEIELDRQRIYAAARERWNAGSEIINALLGRGAFPCPVALVVQDVSACGSSTRSP